MVFSASPLAPGSVVTVLGPIPYQEMGIVDTHNHVWIDPVPGADPSAPVLNQFDSILCELEDFKTRGGGSILDCQPEGCGRNGLQLRELASRSGVNLVACTGFHRKKYYPADHRMFTIRAQKVFDFINSEFEQGLYETLENENPVKAGFIKIALENTWAECPMAAIEGAAMAALHKKCVIQIHTEKGALAEKAILYFTEIGVQPSQIVMCHMDKRPDTGLHKELARLGILLEYDTFYRPKYNPEDNLWPLIDFMVQNQLSSDVALATDMAEKELYRHIGGGAGLSSLPGEIRNRLISKGYPKEDVEMMLGGNIAKRLAGIP